MAGEDRPLTATLLLSCTDRPGLVAAVSEFVFRHGGNIIHAEQHTDAVEGVFFQRVEFEVDAFVVGRDEVADAFRPVAEQFALTWSLRFSDEVPKVAVLVSKDGHCLYDLLTRWRMGELPGRIVAVASNHADLAAAGGHFSLPFHHYPVNRDTRTAQEARLMDLFESHGVDLVVMARYMQILSPDFCTRYPSRIINIHHSFLPAFPGGKPYHQAYERGVKVIGATAHYATANLDEGPIIEQDVTRVSHRDSVPDLVRKGRDLEKVVLARAVRAHLEHKVLVYGTKTVVFD
jgi:formyltetrahydrofolate deformylase